MLSVSVVGKRLGLVALLFASRAAIAEPPLIVEAITARGDDAMEAEAASLRLRDGVRRERREVVAGARLTPAASAEPKSLRLRGTLVRVDGWKALTLEVVDASGTRLATSSARGNYDGAAMVERAIAPLRAFVGEGAPVPRVAAARLAVFAQAEALQLAGDPVAAAARLAFAEPGVALASAAARDVAREIWMDERLPLAARQGLVGRFGLPQEISALTQDGSPEAMLAQVRAHFLLSDLASAAALLAQLPAATRGKHEAAFELALLRGDVAARDASFARLLAEPTPEGMVLLAALPSRALTAAQERSALAAAQTLGAPASHLAAQLALRMVVNDIDRNRALRLVAAIHLQPSDLVVLQSIVQALATQGDPHAAMLVADTAPPPPEPVIAPDALPEASAAPPSLAAQRQALPSTDPVVLRLVEMLAAAQADQHDGHCLAVAWLTSDEFWQRRRPDRAAFVRALRAAVPPSVVVIPSDAVFDRASLVDSELATHARQRSCDALLLVGLAPATNGTRVELFFFEVEANRGQGVAAVIVGAPWINTNWRAGLLAALAFVLTAISARAAYDHWRRRSRPSAEAANAPPAARAPLASAGLAAQPGAGDDATAAKPSVAAAPEPSAATATATSAATSAAASPPTNVEALLWRGRPSMNPNIAEPLTETIMAARAARASGEQAVATPRVSGQLAVPRVSGPIATPRVSGQLAVPNVPMEQGVVANADLILGRYRLQGELGHGAAGTVLKAYDENLGRTVAIKVMAPTLRDNAVAMALFVREAQALAKLNHTNIVAIYDQARDDNATYLIMEYVDGSTLPSMHGPWRRCVPWSTSSNSAPG